MEKVIIALLIALSLNSAAQSFSGRTVEAHVDLKGQPVNAAMPNVVWTMPALESTFSDETTLQIEAMVSSDEPLSEILLTMIHGGDTLRKTLPFTTTELKATVSQKVRLMNGDNRIELTVTNSKGGKVSSTRHVITGKDNAIALSANRKDYALIIATDKYEHWNDLMNPINDATMIASILKDKYGFQVETVTNPTLEEVLEKLTDYNTRKFNIQDQLFIFFAGHGSFDEVLGEGYVVASNSLKNDRGRTTYLPHTVLRQRIDNIKCEHIFLSMDVCFGGTIDPVLASTRAADEYSDASDLEYIARKLSKRTRKFLTSGSKEYVSDGVAGRHSPFAAKFVQALRGVGDGKDRIITLSELQTFFIKLPSEPRFGSFGSDDKASDFVFVVK